MGVHRPPKCSSSSDAKLFPPGFRFHPTDEELVLYYLKRKICRRKLKPDIIAETDVYKWDPDDLPDLSKLKTGDRQWFFLSPRDRRYPNGGRSNRATMNGYWKATGKDRAITCNSRSVGLKKTLVYYKGRAPSGERTDWVMHEYTLDEEELKRCPAQDYYVLYKLYKKSGPGPKNGEQYGAPFKEEDWADDECVGFNGFLDQDNIVKEADNSCIDYNKAKNLPQGQLDDIDVFLQKIADDAVFVPPLGIGHSYTFDEVFAEKENGRTLVNRCSGQVSLPDQNMVPYHYPQPDVRGNFENTSPPGSGLPIEASEMVPNARKDCEQEFGELFSEDFLEIDDLLGPQPSVQQFEEPLSTTGINGFTESNMYNDAALVVHDMGQDELHPRQGLVSQPYLTSNPDCGMTKVQSQSYLNTVGDEGMSYHHLLFHNEENMMSSQLWAPEPRLNLQTPEANRTAASQPNDGVMCNGESSSLPTGAIQNQICPEDDGTASWLSATLWSFVESIPTTPASASENALVNKAFERMSSFSRLKTKNAAGRPTTSRRVQKFVGGMFSFSVIGIVCAILWVLIGTSVKLLGKYISS